MKLRILYVIAIICTLFLSSCDEPWTLNDLVSSNIPNPGFSGERENGLYYYRARPDNGFFVFRMENGRIKRSAYNYVTDSRSEANRIAEIFRSGKWLSATEPYPLSISTSGKVLYWEFSQLNGIPVGGQIEKVMDNWETRGWQEERVIFGHIKRIDEYRYNYTTYNIFGLDISGEITSDAESGLSIWGSSVDNYTYVVKLKAPTHMMAKFLADFLGQFVEYRLDSATTEVNGCDVTIVGHSEYEKNIHGSLPPWFITVFDGFTHQPIQCLLLGNSDVGSGRSIYP